MEWKLLLIFLPWLLIAKVYYKVEDFTEPDIIYQQSLDYHPEDYIDSFTDYQKHDYFQY
ncbi:protein new-glue 4 [Drosophila eugracilis]|uniref:protein new-glue 4 n=1 Tax=Drosophila eugracilis TaxID=29029 RepID=UPI0007E6D0AB|nr:protein new-glue 4 [Drosophila eugracilis]